MESALLGALNSPENTAPSEIEPEHFLDQFSTLPAPETSRLPCTTSSPAAKAWGTYSCLVLTSLSRSANFGAVVRSRCHGSEWKANVVALEGKCEWTLTYGLAQRILESLAGNKMASSRTVEGSLRPRPPPPASDSTGVCSS